MITRYAGYWCLIVFWSEVAAILWLLWAKTGLEFFRCWLIGLSKGIVPTLYVLYLMDFKIKVSRQEAARSIDGFYLWAAHLSVKQWELMAFKLIPTMAIIIVLIALLPFAWRKIYRRLLRLCPSAMVFSE